MLSSVIALILNLTRSSDHHWPVFLNRYLFFLTSCLINLFIYDFVCTVIDSVQLTLTDSSDFFRCLEYSSVLLLLYYSYQYSIIFVFSLNILFTAVLGNIRDFLRSKRNISVHWGLFLSEISFLLQEFWFVSGQWEGSVWRNGRRRPAVNMGSIPTPMAHQALHPPGVSKLVPMLFGRISALVRYFDRPPRVCKG